MKITVIPGNELTPALMQVWAAIQRNNPDLQSPYFRPEFTRAVASVRDDVYIALLEEEGRTVGFFPFQRNWLKLGKPVGGKVSDCQGLVVEQGLQCDPAEVVRQCGLAAWDFDHVIAAQQVFSPFRAVQAESPIMDLSQGYQAYAAERKAAGTKEIDQTARKRRKIEREVGPLRFVINSDDGEAFRKCLLWKSQQYAASGLMDLFKFPWAVDLLEHIWQYQGEEFAGLLSVLYVDDEVASVHFGMRSRNVWHYWFPSYDLKYARYSTGLILLLEMAQACEDLGVKYIDLGKGDERYKQSLASHAVPLMEGSIQRKTPVTMVRRFRNGAEAFLKSSSIFAPVRYPGRLLTRAEKWLNMR